MLPRELWRVVIDHCLELPPRRGMACRYWRQRLDVVKQCARLARACRTFNSHVKRSIMSPTIVVAALRRLMICDVVHAARATDTSSSLPLSLRLTPTNTLHLDFSNESFEGTLTFDDDNRGAANQARFWRAIIERLTICHYTHQLCDSQQPCRVDADDACRMLTESDNVNMAARDATRRVFYTLSRYRREHSPGLYYPCTSTSSSINVIHWHPATLQPAPPHEEVLIDICGAFIECSLISTTADARCDHADYSTCNRCMWHVMRVCCVYLKQLCGICVS